MALEGVDLSTLTHEFQLHKATVAGELQAMRARFDESETKFELLMGQISSLVKSVDLLTTEIKPFTERERDLEGFINVTKRFKRFAVWIGLPGIGATLAAFWEQITGVFSKNI